jgi:hypothetical protein
MRAGTNGNVKVVTKTYLKKWVKDSDRSQITTENGYSPDHYDGVVFAIGQKSEGHCYGMKFGPSPNLEEMKNICGDDGDCILMFDSDYNEQSSKEIFRWDNGRWESVENDN